MIAAGYWLVVADIGLGVAAGVLAVLAVFAFVLWVHPETKGGESWAFALALVVFVLLAVLAAAGATAIHAA